MIEIGDTFTITGMMQLNPDRRWWQWWKPRLVTLPAKTFQVVRKVGS